MKCPKCKIDINPQVATCPGCKLRLCIDCPKCGGTARLGSPSCKKCGFVFVKFCPQCNSANYVSSNQCRKCFYNFAPDEDVAKEEEPQEETAQKPAETPKSPSRPDSSKLVMFIDFTTLDGVFSKYKDEEFKQKVLLNIKTSIKMGFNSACDFFKPTVAMFKVNYTKKYGLLDKIKAFSDEFEKFNNILSDTLGVDISYKFAIITEDEIKKAKSAIEQLAFGIEKDIIASSGAFTVLNEEIPLIKISPNSYKMVFLEQKPEFSQSECVSEEVALELLWETINDEASEIKAISVNAPRGCGKTHLINNLQKKLEDTQNIILLGQCSPLTQVSPFGLFQDVLLSLFNLTFAPSKFEKHLKDLKTLLSKSFENCTNVETRKIETLANIVYPIKEDFYENILINKQQTFEDLKDVLEALRADNKLVLAIDDFDLIDESSFEFLKYLIKKDFFKNGTKLLLTYKNQHAIGMYMNTDKLPKNACLNINLAQKETGDIQEYIHNQFQHYDLLPQKILDQIILNSQGNFAYIEQVLHYFIDSGKVYFSNDTFCFDTSQEEYFVPPTLGEILKLRFDYLKEQFGSEYNFLTLASLLGGKFNKSVLAKVFNLQDEDFYKISDSLVAKGYIIRISENSYMFRNNLVWTYTYNCAKEDEDLKDAAREFLNEICQRTVSSPSIRALLAQTVNDKKLAFELWTQNLKLASYIGDVSLYILSQKQSLSLLEDARLPNVPYVKNNICERLGKLVYEKNPKDAIDYLSNAIVWAQNKSNEYKVVELSGYLVHSCYLAQRFPAVIETVDAVLNIFSKNKQEIQRALIKTRKLDALLYMGNWEEIASLVNNEINPVLQEFFKHPKRLDFTTVNEIYDSWLNANITLVDSYSQQGNPLAFELIEEIEKEILKNKANENVKSKVNLALTTAFAHTMKGYFTISDEILQCIVKDFSYAIEDSTIVCKWNIIDLFNKVLRHDYDKIKDELFEAVTFANNSGDEYSKNIIKTLLAHVLLDENNPLKALEICAEEMSFFSNEKIAFGALMAWYISAKATLKVHGPDRAIEICEKAIGICQGSRINNVYFKILFYKIMTEGYLVKGELDSAKMYCEMGLQEANANEITYLQMALYRVRALCMQDSVPTVPEEKKLELAQNTIRVYERAISLANKLNLQKHHYTMQKELTAFKAYCHLHRIS